MATNAISLNGSTQYGKIDTFTELAALTEYTIEYWVKNTTTSTAYARLSRMFDGSTEFHRFTTENGTGNQGFNFSTQYAGTNADGYEGSTRLTHATWVQVSIVHHTASKKTRIYLNGVENNAYNLQNTGTSTLQVATNMDFWFGQSGISDRYFDGDLGGYLRIWNRALTGGEVYDNYDLRRDPTEEGSSLIVNCNFSEGSGTTVDNDATAGEDLDLYNTPTWVTGPTLTDKVYDKTLVYLQSTDNSEEANAGGTPDINSSDLEMNQESAVDKRIGVRFEGVDLDKDVTIVSAYLYLVGDEAKSAGTVDINIYCEDVDDSAAFSTGVNNLTNRTLTTATVAWDSMPNSAAGVLEISPDIKAALQEVVDRGSYANGNDVTVIITPGTNKETRTWESDSGQAGSAIMLVVDITAPSGRRIFHIT